MRYAHADKNNEALSFQFHHARRDCAADVRLLFAVASGGRRREAGLGALGHVAAEHDGHQHNAVERSEFVSLNHLNQVS